MSVKYQITLPDDLALELKREASKRDVPLAQFIRETMQRELTVAKKKTKNCSADPLASITGLIDGGPDFAARVDEILYR